MTVGRALAPWSLLALAAGCSSPPTQLVVVVGSDYAPETELARIRVRTTVDEGRIVDVVADLDDSDPPREVTIPFSFGVVPHGDDFSRVVHVELVPILAGDEPAFTAFVETSFVEGKSLRLPIFLAQACEGVDCADPETSCDRGLCLPAYRDPRTLSPFRVGDPLDDDAGIPDAAPHDASLDAESDAQDDAQSDAQDDAEGDAMSCASPCEALPLQCGCDPNLGCYLDGTSFACLTAGETPDGAACATNADCMRGSTCVGLGLGDPGTCERLCESDAPCSDAYCAQLDVAAPAGGCLPGCLPIVPFTGCPSELACRAAVIVAFSGEPRFGTICARPEGTALGGACTGSSECAPGLGCVDFTCQEICLVGSDSCPGGYSCDSFDDLFSYGPLVVNGAEYGICRTR